VLHTTPLIGLHGVYRGQILHFYFFSIGYDLTACHFHCSHTKHCVMDDSSIFISVLHICQVGIMSENQNIQALDFHWQNNTMEARLSVGEIKNSLSLSLSALQGLTQCRYACQYNLC